MPGLFNPPMVGEKVQAFMAPCVLNVNKGNIALQPCGKIKFQIID